VHRRRARRRVVIKTLEDSGLRGLGGAGFPAGRKWRIVRSEPAPRLMAVNIDEGEPGTFKDRVYLERDPHRFIEGMLIAAWAVGISKIYVYLRDEYHGCRALLEAELAKLRAAPPYPGMPEIVLRRGAGAYICGEESAMIESIEGKRGMPRLRPPYVAQVGLFGRPTLEHNFETLYWVRDLLDKGGEWFAAHGRNGRKGLRSFSVSGRVREPGVKLAPAGITLQELIDEHCGGMLPGHTLYGYLPAAPRAGSCRRRSRTFRSTSTRCSRTAASSALPPSWSCPTTTARSARRATRCASSSTSRAASARRAATAPPRRRC
jgi:formate dehydrogenase